MPSRTRRALAAPAVAAGLLAAALAAVPSAGAVTGGVPDGQAHPAVAVLLVGDGQGTQRCSATLVSPTVLLTAAHCVQDPVGLAAVSFESALAGTAAELSALPYPGDPALGYRAADLAGRDDWHAGTPHAHPEYSGFTDAQRWLDVGVVVLDEPVPGPAPAALAPEGLLDGRTARELNGELFTVVGYGAEVRADGSGRPLGEDVPLLRRSAQVAAQRLTPQLLMVQGNAHDARGTGGPCTGDSGGPALDADGRVVAVTSWSSTPLCRSRAGLQRVDVPQVQDWLAGHGVPLARDGA
jgi:hypothetical protein